MYLIQIQLTDKDNGRTRITSRVITEHPFEYISVPHYDMYTDLISFQKLTNEDIEVYNKVGF